MIKLKGLSKYYGSSDKKIIGVKDINLEFNSTGFVFILGKSGCGKTTLLNIIGALDTFDEGEFIFNNINTRNYTNLDWNKYRGINAGFIFQEFNLLEDFTVKENIALPLELMNYEKEVINKQIIEILEKVELSELGDRKVYELSGGQKQRVAIARALIKNPYLILADEPTGNLDSETSKVILDLLKDISKDRLVIMVTHDEEYSRLYGDRIIKLKDGVVISDEILTEKRIEDTGNVIKENKQLLLPFKYTLQLAFKSLFSKKLKLIFINILFIMALIMVSFAFIFTNYSFAETTYKTFKMNNITEYNFQYTESCYEDCKYLNQEIIDNIDLYKNKYPDLDIFKVLEYRIHFNRFKSIFLPNHDSKFTAEISQIIFYDDKNRLTLEHGTLPENEDEILISDYIAYALLEHKIFDFSNIKDLIDQELKYYETDEYFIPFKIKGIVDTNFEKFFNDNTIDYHLISSYKVIYLNNRNLTYIRNHTNSFSTYLRSEDKSVGFSIIGRIPDDINQHQKSLYGTVPTKVDEVIISLTSVMEAENVQYDEFINNKDFIINKYLNKILPLINPYNNPNGVEPLEDGYKVTGILNDVESPYNEYISSESIYLYDDHFNDAFNQYFLGMKHHGLVYIGNKTDSIRLLSDIHNNGYVHNTHVSNELYDYNKTIKQFKDISYWLTLFICIFTSILMYTFISNSIEYKKKDIGILRSLGLSGKDCSKIFIIESIIIDIFVTIIAIITTVYLANRLNKYLNYLIGTNIAYLDFNIVSISLLIMFGLLLAIISSYLPVRSIARMKPIEAIKNNK